MSSFKSLALVVTFLLSRLPLVHASASAEAPASIADDRLVFHGGVSGLFDSEKPPAIALEYRWSASKAGLQPWLGAGWATDGAIFAGGGLLHTWRVASRWELVTGFGPVYYDRHEGLDLGSQLEFYSFAEAGWEISPGRRLLLRFAHISNASMSEINPGTELLTLGFSLRLP
ncbi:acyloxyacyl hydrolase [Nibricoccus aquaticus]|nr:acyloxyacyl hydrolase [Nibricoccus aquaticus]